MCKRLFLGEASAGAGAGAAPGEGLDGPEDDLLYHGLVAVGLLQLGGRDPDLPVGGDVLPRLVQHLPRVLVGLQPVERAVRCKDVQGSAGKCREVQGAAGMCRKVQGGAGRCKKVQESAGDNIS